MAIPEGGRQGDQKMPYRPHCLRSPAARVAVAVAQVVTDDAVPYLEHLVARPAAEPLAHHALCESASIL